MYRAVALAAIEAGIDLENHKQLAALAADLKIDLEGDPDSLRILLAGRDITELIRTERVTEVSSIVSTVPGVRRAMVERQREIARRGGVLNGRDIGTVVFPTADVKFFLTAVPEKRAKRRFDEQSEIDPAVDYSEVFADMTERDRRDSTRADSPLKIAPDAIVIDSSGLSIQEVFDQMMETIRLKGT